MRYSDEDHPVTTNDIIQHLKNHDISAERKSIYADIKELEQFGLNIVSTGSGRNAACFLAERDFELTELTLMADIIQASKFITSHKTDVLLKKLETLTSENYAEQFKRQTDIGL